MSEQHIILHPDSEDTGERIDKYISEELSDISRSYVKKLTGSKKISVLSMNGASKAVKPSYIVSEGDEIHLILPEPEKLEITAENIPLNIIFEDDDIIIIDKPQGMVVHPAPGNMSGTLVNALMYHCGSSLSSINGVERPGIVHRIDKDTSGLLVICKTDRAHRSLAEQFSVHSINRVYSCITYNHFDPEKMDKYTKDDFCASFSADDSNDSVINKFYVPHTTVDEFLAEDGNIYTITIDKALARSNNDRKKIACDPSGRKAITHVYLKQQLAQNFSYVKCKLETGRTHQIRVHLTSINHPLLGDEVYGPKKCPFNLKGQVLHAGLLGFIHPVTNEYVEFKSELPEYFKRLLSNLSLNDS